MTGVETLVRWPDGKGKFRAPGEFLPVADQLSVVADIDAIVFQRALAEMRGLGARGLKVPKVSFNVTAARLQDAALLDTIGHHAPDDIVVGFEILESVLVEEQSTAFSYHLDRLRETGVSIEIDDFGSGHASIIGLTHAAPDVMKIDQRLIFPLTRSEVSRRMVKSIIEIGQALDIKVTAEGVETLEHAHLLGELGCDTLQGYYFAKPMAISDLAKFLETHETESEPGAKSQSA